MSTLGWLATVAATATIFWLSGYGIGSRNEARRQLRRRLRDGPP